MAQTISELEKERAKLLEAIEAQASQISTHRSSSGNEARPHRLNDWLNAAEQVLPDPNRTAAPPPTATNKKTAREAPRTTASHARSKASFFGVIVMLSLLLTILGVIYIAYTSIQKDLRQVMMVHSESIDTLGQLQTELNRLAKTVEEGGDSEAFGALMVRLDQIEQELNGVKHLQANAAQGTSSALNPNVLQNVSQRLERQMDHRIQTLVQQIQNAGISLNVSSPAATTAFEQEQIVEMRVAEPIAPTPPRVEQKVVRLVEPAAKTASTTTATASVSADVSWLSSQNPEGFTLQLASMPDAAALEKLKRDKNLLDGKIIPQYRDGKLNYVLLRGSYGERTQANQASLTVKETTGISPWVRRMKDLTPHLNQP